MKKYMGWILVISGIVIDQITKLLALNLKDSVVIIPNLLNFTLVKNYGAAFGIAQGANGILAGISACICILMLVMIFYLDKKEEPISMGLFLVLSGGFANLLDRAFRGFVVDFIDTPFIATFNIADSLIVIGCFWLVIEELCISIFSKKSK